MPDRCPNYNKTPEGTKPTPCELRDNVHAPLLFTANSLQSENHLFAHNLGKHHDDEQKHCNKVRNW
jgi:hypothetical protein